MAAPENLRNEASMLRYRANNKEIDARNRQYAILDAERRIRLANDQKMRAQYDKLRAAGQITLFFF